MPLAVRILVRLAVVLLVVAAICAALAAGVFYAARAHYERELPSAEAVRELPLQSPLRIYTRDGKLIGEFGAERREPLALEDVPQPLIDAFLAAEDARFYRHPGVDVRSLLRAAIALVRTGERAQGGSTITMQLARNYFLTRERTYDRKIREIFLALRMEEQLTKEQILETYLNKIFLGERSYGIGAAARAYFGVPVDELTVAQMATLAGLPRAPSLDNPARDPLRATARRSYVLRRMHTLGMIDDDAFETASAEPMIVTPAAMAVETDAHYVAEMVRLELMNRFGESVYTDGYTVTTTIDSRKQEAANRAVRRHVRAHSARRGYSARRPMLPDALIERLSEDPLPADVGTALAEKLPRLVELARAVVLSHESSGVEVLREDGERLTLPPEAYEWANFGDQRLRRGSLVYLEQGSDGWRLAADPDAQGALVALHPDTGAIEALVGGYDFFAGRFNRVVQAERQPGSAIKPIFYAAAMERGYTPASVIIDAPIVMDDFSLEAEWRPRNHSGRFHGPTRLREAMVHSRNIVSIKLMQAVGIEPSRAFAAQLGLPLQRMPRNYSLALGSPSLTPMEMATAFATFANGGYRIAPYFIEEIRGPGEIGGLDLGGGPTQVVCEGDSDSELCAPRVMDERVAWLLNDMMRDVTRRGTGSRARELGRDDIAGKTGTTNEGADAWFIGSQRGLTAAAWVGHDTPRPLGRGEGGGRTALPIWMDFMRTALDGVPEYWPLRPDGLVDVRVEADSGLLAAPDSVDGLFEIVQVEHVPRTATGVDRIRGDGGTALDALY